ncbi:hypothetical protein ACSDQ9_03640 [Aestuariimicrobium soli]|uniref:hypothetical protein n=1 Tax=Aestuariimicrobium soli TaxID=2035834 RepID=UPI003EBADA54
MISRRTLGLATLATAGLATGLVSSTGDPRAAASPLQPAGITTETGWNAARGCIENGWFYQPASGNLAQGPHCFATQDASTVSRVATKDAAKTRAQLTAVQSWSPLHPDHYLAKGTMATRGVADAPRATNSATMAKVVNAMPSKFVGPDLQWLRTGSNIGGGVRANDNIPVYTVDSSNPYQTFQTFNSTDARVVNFPKLMQLCSGSIPLPTWAKPSDGGDHSLAIFDVATGIWRSYFNAQKDAKGVWQYSAAGYLYGDAASRHVSSRNFWLSLVQGSSSVVGLANELTQIGFEEVRRGVINHMVSVTFPDYRQNLISFPAKQTDGRSSDANAPQAGQVFTFPKSFDVDAYVAAHGIDQVTAAIMRAVKTYGGMVTDRNNFCMAFNFENPYGMGVRASDPNANPWKTDAVVAPRINAMDINAFPWQLTEWIAPHWAGTAQATPTVVTRRAVANDLIGLSGDTLVDARTGAAVGRGFTGTRQLVRATGLTASGSVDLLTVNSAGELWLSPASSTGWSKSTSKRIGWGWGGFSHLMHLPIGGAKGSLVAVEKSTGALWRYPMTSATTFGSRVKIGQGWGTAVLTTIVADANLDKLPDLVATFSDGRLMRFGFDATGRIVSTTKIGWGWQGWIGLVQGGQLGGDSRRDLIAVRGDRAIFSGVWSGTQSVIMTQIGKATVAGPFG